MFRDNVAMVGRQSELAVVEKYAEASALVLLRGSHGAGKTTLLGEVQRLWRERGLTVLRMNLLDAFPQWDEYASQAVVKAIRNSFHEIGDSRVADAMAAVSRSSDPETYASAAERSVLFADLVRLFRCLRAKGSVAVLVDDVQAAPDPELAVAAAQKAGCTVVVACREDDSTAEPTSLSTIAERVLDLMPLPDEQVGELLAAATSGRLDESVAPALRAHLGSLAGNPGTVLGTFEQLREDGRLTEVQGRLCLSDPDAPVALPAEHHLARHLARLGEQGMQLIALVDGTDQFSVDDLLTFTAATGRELGGCGRLVDDLVAVGALDYDDDGILNLTCPALTATMLAELGADGVASLHRVLAEYLLRDGRAQLAEPAAVADHIALAGSMLEPDTALVPFLECEATRVLRVNPVLAARWYRAALRHCEPGGADRDRILGIVLRLLVRVAHYRCLSDVVCEAIAEGVEDERRYELAVSAALAAVHTGVPVPASVYSALAPDARGRAPLEFAAAWFSGKDLFAGEKVEAAFGAFRVSEERFQPVEAFGDQVDIVKMFKRVLGSEYGEPVGGPIVIFRRLVRNFGSGGWSSIPSDAREFELASPVETAQHQITRLLAAEVFAAMGDSATATLWLESSGESSIFPALRAWVKLGIHYRSGEWIRDTAQGRAAYAEIAAGVGEDSELALLSFLVRHAWMEHQVDGARLQGIHDDTKRWYARYGGENLQVAELLLRTLVERDYAAGTEAVKIIRRRDDISELMRALMMVGHVAEDPRPWYHEAYEIVERLGSSRVRTFIKNFMRRDAVAAPSSRADGLVLTDTEKRVIGLIQQGLTNRQIAGAVQVSERTVENTLTRLFAKTGCRSRLDLATAILEGRWSSPNGVSAIGEREAALVSAAASS